MSPIPSISAHPPRAASSRIELLMVYGLTDLRLRVIDNGCGIDPDVLAICCTTSPSLRIKRKTTLSRRRAKSHSSRVVPRTISHRRRVSLRLSPSAAAEFADRHSVLCATCYGSNTNLGAIDRFLNDDGLAGMCRNNAGSNLKLQRLFQ